MVSTQNRRLGGLYKQSRHRIGGLEDCRNCLDTGYEAWRTVEMVWTQDRRLGGL
jgi:hypothetical protein